MNVVEHHYDVLPSIAAENAANRAKIKQEYDLICVINNDISKADLYIESLKRDNKRYNELLEIKNLELVKLDEELDNLSLSREQIQCNTDNLKKQYELTLIDDEQRKKEQDKVCVTYEKMIANRREIFNSNRLVVRKNNFENRVEAARIQSSVLEGKLKDLERQKRQLREIENLYLKAVSVELADVWLTSKKEKENIFALQNELKEKENVFNQLSSQKSKPIISPRTPSSQIVSLPIPTLSPPLQIPVLKNTDETELTKYFQRINLFKKKERSPFSLPSVLSRTLSQKLKESLSNSPKRSPIAIKSPVKKITEEISTQVNENVEPKKKNDNSPKIIDEPDEPAKTNDSHSINASDEIIIDVQPNPPETRDTEKTNQTSALSNTYSPKPNSPGKMKFVRSFEKRSSPLTVSRLPTSNISRKSPTSSSRIPVPVSSNSPIRTTSRIPVSLTPIKAYQKKAIDKEPPARKPELAKKSEIPKNLDIIIDTGDTLKQKKREVHSPVRGVKYPKMDYAYLQNVNPNLQKNRPKGDTLETPFMQVDQFKKTFAKNDINMEDIYKEAINENNPIARSHAERIKALREGYPKKDADDLKKPEPKKLMEEQYEINDVRHLSKEKYNEFVKPYEKFRMQENVRKIDQHELRDFRDSDKLKSDLNVKECILQINTKEGALKELQDRNNFSEMSTPYEYEDSYRQNDSFYTDLDEKSSGHSAISTDHRNRSEVFSPISATGFVSPPNSNNFSTPLFAPIDEKGSMFSFGSSVNQLFGGRTDGANNQTKNQNNGFFGFNFSTSDETMNQPFKLF